jgi:molybdopterin-guanine dinucleotide biosynthesis protein A
LRDTVPIANPNFAAVLLAGGRSTRMGRDKATLLVDGQPLWQRQLATLRMLTPSELFISGRRDGPFASANVEVIEDAVPGLGPLAGIAAALRRAESPRILVLAIDLPAMTADFLRRLLRQDRPTIPKQADHYEPLAAVYPKSALPLAEEFLRESDRSMQRFVRRLLADGVIETCEVSPAEAPLFQNVNRPEDIA